MPRTRAPKPLSQRTHTAQRFPGDPKRHQHLARMVRVDHAGEYGAVRIYQGQRRVLGEELKNNPRLAAVLAHMEAQERAHLASFETLLEARGIRPSALLPLWHVLGYAMGALTARLGVKEAMACTVAVEEVIDTHYRHQEETLATMQGEEKLRALLAAHRADENAHREIGLEHGAEHARAYPLLRRAIRAATKLAIGVSERI